MLVLTAVKTTNISVEIPRSVDPGHQEPAQTRCPWLAGTVIRSRPTPGDLPSGASTQGSRSMNSWD
jgi:hypothetical protein